MDNMYFVCMFLFDDETGVEAKIGDIIAREEFDRLTKRSEGVKPHYIYNDKSYEIQAMWAVKMEKVI